MVRFAADGSGGHAGGDYGGFYATDVQVSKGPVAGQVKIGEVGVVGGEARVGAAREA